MSKRFSASFNEIDNILKYVCLKAIDEGYGEIDHLKLIVDEAVSNVIEHSNSHFIDVEISKLSPKGWTIIIKDDGFVFNPLECVQASLDDSEGLGIYLIKKLTNSVEYLRENGCNILTLCYLAKTNEVIPESEILFAEF